MKDSTKDGKKKIFLVKEIQNGDILYSTFVLAANLKSLRHTSLMRKILLNKSFDSIIDIEEI